MVKTQRMVMEHSGEPGRRGRFWRRVPAVVGTAMLVYFLPVFAGCMNLSTPVDYIINMGTFPHRPELVAPADGRRCVVFLKHGLFRSAASLWKLERALRDHGYEVVNISYPSTKGYIEDFSTAMAREVADYLEGTPRDSVRVHFVGHSMGGLVIRHYLGRPDALRPDSCIFVATPHHGAALSDARKDNFLFQTFLGDKAVLEMSPGSEFYRSLPPLPSGLACGNIYGSSGDPEGWNDDVPGDDDGTVGAEEARLPELPGVKSCRLRLGHTRISFSDRTVLQVLHYLKLGSFKK